MAVLKNGEIVVFRAAPSMGNRATGKRQAKVCRICKKPIPKEDKIHKIRRHAKDFHFQCLEANYI